MSGQSFKMFVSEEEVVEQRQRRQAEWDKVRKEDDPKECPEEESRSLFEQLEANKNYHDREQEDENKLRSSVKGLDDEEVQFLNLVSSRQMQIEKERNTEEKSLIREMEAAQVVKVDSKAKDQTAKPEQSKTTKPSSSSSSGSGRKSQLQLLSGAIKRKSVDSAGGDAAKRTKSTEDDSDTETTALGSDTKLMTGLPKGSSGVAVVAGILPGISRYDDDDSSTEASTNSSDSEDDHRVYPSAVTQRVLQEMIKKIKNG